MFEVLSWKFLLLHLIGFPFIDIFSNGSMEEDKVFLDTFHNIIEVFVLAKSFTSSFPKNKTFYLFLNVIGLLCNTWFTWWWHELRGSFEVYDLQRDEWHLCSHLCSSWKLFLPLLLNQVFNPKNLKNYLLAKIWKRN